MKARGADKGERRGDVGRYHRGRRSGTIGDKAAATRPRLRAADALPAVVHAGRGGAKRGALRAAGPGPRPDAAILGSAAGRLTLQTAVTVAVASGCKAPSRRTSPLRAHTARRHSERRTAGIAERSAADRLEAIGRNRSTWCGSVTRPGVRHRLRAVGGTARVGGTGVARRRSILWQIRVGRRRSVRGLRHVRNRTCVGIGRGVGGRPNICRRGTGIGNHGGVGRSGIMWHSRVDRFDHLTDDGAGHRLLTALPRFTGWWVKREQRVVQAVAGGADGRGALRRQRVAERVAGTLSQPHQTDLALQAEPALVDPLGSAALVLRVGAALCTLGAGLPAPVHAETIRSTVDGPSQVALGSWTWTAAGLAVSLTADQPFPAQVLGVALLADQRHLGNAGQTETSKQPCSHHVMVPAHSSLQLTISTPSTAAVVTNATPPRPALMIPPAERALATSLYQPASSAQRASSAAP